jgi:hypothetical protein
MAVIVVVPGILDIRQGWTGKPYPPELVERLERQKAARGVVRHPAELARERDESERQREAERRAEHPDPRGDLRAAHVQRLEAATEVDRVGGLRGKAADLVDELAARESEAVAALRERNTQSAEALVAALSVGSGSHRRTTPRSPRWRRCGVGSRSRGRRCSSSTCRWRRRAGG